jgi:hypothetical protein
MRAVRKHAKNLWVILYIERSWSLLRLCSFQMDPQFFRNTRARLRGQHRHVRWRPWVLAPRKCLCSLALYMLKQAANQLIQVRQTRLLPPQMSL